MRIRTPAPARAARAAALALLGAACAALHPAEPVSVTEGSPPEVSLSVGQQLLVRLDENPTTGYIWEAEGFDRSILKADIPSFNADPASRGRLGAGGVKTLPFTAAASGKTDLVLVNHRSWLRKDGEAKRLVFHVTVR